MDTSSSHSTTSASRPPSPRPPAPLDGGCKAPRASSLGAQGIRILLPLSPAAPQPYLERIAVELRGKVRSIPVEEIDYIVADGPYAELHTGDRRHVIRESMQTLEERLDPKHFMRVHRSMIVRLDLVDTLHRGAGGDDELQLKNGTRVKVSRARREALERWLGVSE